jgi:hypothetical protein
MTEYEIRDVLTSTLSGSTSVLSVLISVISAYLIVSWLVGKKLSRPQVVWVNLLFITFSSMTVLRWITGYRVAMGLQQNLRKVNADLFAGTTQITPELIAGLGCILFAAILGSLKFMWDVRHPKTE